MAEKEKKLKIILERTYNVPLRKGWLKAPRYKRTNRAVVELRSFLSRHMKSEDLKIGKKLNELMWQHGIKNPPHHVKVNAKKDEDGVVKVELEGFEYVEPVKPQKKEEKPTGLKGKLAETLGKTDKSKEESKEEPKEEKKKEMKATEKTKKTVPEAKTKDKSSSPKEKK
ncbi:MAG: 60S ribosomal protein L31 [Nanoarchaeota archaeon]|nr:60S ribosomal protein L31 [Nanoarchaeota archaeon]MBU1850431.1 60S ribosomal protein L31 [Nanoarchaeota archaeon]